jgi:hypothetical protein
VLVIVVRNRGHKASDPKGQAFNGILADYGAQMKSGVKILLISCLLNSVNVELYITILQPDHKYKNIHSTSL